MSKIMRALYAEARAAREAAALAQEKAEAIALAKPSASDPIKAPGIAWWEARYENAKRALVDRVAATAIEAVSRPCTPDEHVEYWLQQMARSRHPRPEL